jgi:hypothetical protein
MQVKISNNAGTNCLFSNPSGSPLGPSGNSGNAPNAKYVGYSIRCSCFLQIGRSRVINGPPKKPLNPDARTAQIYPTKDFTSLRRQDSWFSGAQGPITFVVFLGSGCGRTYTH